MDEKTLASGTRSLRIARAASSAYALLFVAGSVLSVRRRYVAAPLGIRTGLSPLADVLVGNGAALAAPWPMLVALGAANRAARENGPRGRRARARMVVLGTLFLAGSAAEPISHRLVAGTLPAPEAIVAALDLFLPLAIVTGATASLVVGEETDRREELR